MKSRVLDRAVRADLSAQSQTGWITGVLDRLISSQSTSGNEKEVTGYVTEILGTLKGGLFEVPVLSDLPTHSDFVANPSEQPYFSRPNMVHRKKGSGNGRKSSAPTRTSSPPGGTAFSARTGGRRVLLRPGRLRRHGPSGDVAPGRAGAGRRPHEGEKPAVLTEQHISRHGERIHQFIAAGEGEGTKGLTTA